MDRGARDPREFRAARWHTGAMRVLRAVAYVYAGLISCAVAAPAAAQDTDDADVGRSVAALRDLSSTEAEFFRLINEYRAGMGAPPLTATRLLNQVAYDHSLDMGQRRFFSHTNPDGLSPFDRMRQAGYAGGAMAENIAGGSATAAAAFDQWRNSPGHNQNMLNPAYRAIGIGHAQVPGSPYVNYWTTVFGDVVDPSGGTAGDGGVVGGTGATGCHCEVARGHRGAVPSGAVGACVALAGVIGWRRRARGGRGGR
jgi:uncharacterized protein YkwD